jgi:predicted PurR-regulated permease PerM
MGQTGTALALGAWFAAVVGLSDNVARPLLLGSRMRLPLPLVVIAVAGGLLAFGPLGTLLGPMIAAATLAGLQRWRRP